MPRSLWIVVAVSLLGLAISIARLVGDRPAARDSRPPGELVIAVTPEQELEEQQRRYEPLLRYLESVVGIPCRIVVPADYADLFQRFVADEFDLAWFGGLGFVRASRQADAIPVAMRDVDARFTSVYIVRQDSEGEALTDYRGRRLAFGDPLSTSGHLMPRMFMLEVGIVPEEFFSAVEYSGAHDRTVAWVADGTVEVGVANRLIVERQFASGALSTEGVRILDETPTYYDYVLAARRDLHPATVVALRDALLAIDASDATQAAVLESQRCSYFLPAARHEFDEIERAGEATGLLEGRP